MSLLHQIGQKPVIAAIREPARVETALQTRVDNIFFMGGNVKHVMQAVKRAKEKGKGTFVHPDLIRGLSSTDKEVVEFVSDCIGADGIVTPKSHMIREAKKMQLYGILHLFAIDSLAWQNGVKLVENIQPDGIEIMPGVIDKIIEDFAQRLEHIPIIASGMIQNTEEAKRSLQAGATSLSVSEASLWKLTFDHLYAVSYE